jgi:hypothetical protein
MRHLKDPAFQPLLDALPSNTRVLAEKNFKLLKHDPKHPSLHFKCLHGDIWSVRVGRSYRALAIKSADAFQWFWIGSHADYDRLISGS